MTKPRRTILILAGAAFLLIIGFIVFFVLLMTDTVTFTKKIQSVELPDGLILNIYRTSTREYYDCEFELRAHNGKPVIPKTHFYSTTYWSSKSAAGESTPELRSIFHLFVGAQSGVVGLVSTEDEEILLVLIDAARSHYVAATPMGLSTEDTVLGKKLLSELKRDFPKHTLALEATDEAAELRRHRHGLEDMR